MATILKCDRCGVESDQPRSKVRRWVVGPLVNAAGIESSGANKDLCEDCAEYVATEVTRALLPPALERA